MPKPPLIDVALEPPPTSLPIHPLAALGVEALDIGANLHRMAAPDHRQIVGHLLHVLKEAARRVPVGTKPPVPADQNVADDFTGNERKLPKTVRRRGLFTGGGAVERV